MSFAGNLLLRATGQRAVRRFDNLSRAPAQSQQRLLREILGTNADIEFGRRHGQNSEYQTKRKSLRYGAPIIRVVRSGEFDRYRRRLVEQGHRADGQFKVLRLTSDVSFAAEFEADRDLVGGAVATPGPRRSTP
jgi:GH3 auxin-responsive promoter